MQIETLDSNSNPKREREREGLASTINTSPLAHLGGIFENLKAIRALLKLSQLKEEEEEGNFATKSKTLPKLYRFCILAQNFIK